ncbi:MAG TPA: hypothetical protein VIK31_03305 [Propionibacteriaceae bacterium]
MLVFDDLKPFAADLTEAQSAIVIEDVEAELARIAPTLVNTDDPTVMRVLRAAALRYAEYLKSGGRRLVVRDRSRGPFINRDQMAPAAGDADIFTVSEIDKLNAAANVVPTTPLVASPVGEFPCSDLGRLFR